MKKYMVFLIVLVAICLICVFVSIGCYTSVFDGEKSQDREDWNTFGTFFGGVLSPLFSFFSLISVLLIFISEMESNRRSKEDENILKYLEWLKVSFDNMIYKDAFSGSEFVGNALLSEIYRVAALMSQTADEDIAFYNKAGKKHPTNSNRYNYYLGLRKSAQNYIDMLAVVHDLIIQNKIDTSQHILFNVYLTTITNKVILLIGHDDSKTKKLKKYVEIHNINEYKACNNILDKINPLMKLYKTHDEKNGK